MNVTITHEYQLVAAGLMPVWAGVLLAIVITIGVAWLLRGEIRSRKRTGTLVKMLMVNRSIIACILALLLVQPVLYVNRIKTQPGQLILAADRSRSMLRVDASDATTLFNLAAQLKTPGLENRITAGDDARRLLATLRPTLARFRAEVAAAAADLSQGIPPSAGVQGQLAAQLPELTSLSKEMGVLLANLLKTQTPAAATTQPGGPGGDPLAVADKTGADLADITAALAGMANKSLTQESSENLLHSYDVLLKSVDAGSAALTQLQLQLDQRFLAAMKPDERKPFDTFAQKSRFELASLLAAQAAADPQLSAAHRVVLSGFDRLDAGAAEAHTDLYSLIDSSTQQGVDEVVSGLVLFSDGQQNLPERAEVLRRLPGRGIPFVAVGVGSDQPVPDVAVIDYDVPGVIQRDKRTLLTARLKTQLPVDSPINVTLAQPDGTVIARAKAAAGANGRSSVAFEFKLTEPGPQLLTLKASADKPDAAPENDSVAIPFSVIGQPTRVLLIARWPRWDLVHLLQSLGTRPTRVDPVFWGQLSKAPHRGSAGGSIPDTAESLKRYQLVILDGSLFAGAKPEDAQLFSDFTQAGGNLLIIQSDDNSYAHAWPWLENFSNGSTSKPTALTATAISPGLGADGMPIVHLSADAALSRSAWAALAPVNRHTDVSPQHAILLLNAKNEPMMSVGFRGRGKVYLLGVSDLFRTREWAGGASSTRFLGAMVDDALQPLFANAESKAAVYPMTPVAGAPAFMLAQSADALTIKAEDGATPTVAPYKTADKTLTTSGLFIAPAAGKLDLLVGGAIAISSQSIRQLSMEDVDFQLDPARMTALAAAAGGHYVPIAELPAALKQLAPATERTISVRQFELWNLIGLLPFIAALMTLDWYLRRKAGMVL
jgi:hypothetical protein